MDDPDSEDEMQVDQSSQMDSQPKNLFACNWPLKGTYGFSSFITHLGASIHVGHYVCHIRKGEDWVYFNDAKVAITPEPPFGKGFIYVFSKEI